MVVRCIESVRSFNQIPYCQDVQQGRSRHDQVLVLYKVNGHPMHRLIVRGLLFVRELFWRSYKRKPRSGPILDAECLMQIWVGRYESS